MDIWEQEGIVLSVETYAEIAEGMIDFVVQRTKVDPMTEFPVCVFIVSPSKSNDTLEISMWPVLGEFGPETQYECLYAVGERVATAGMQITLAFVIAEAWSVLRRAEDMPANADLSKLDDRKEVITIAGCDVLRRCCRSVLAIDRDPDINSIVIGAIERFLPTPEQPNPTPPSVLNDALMQGYIAKVHMDRYGVAIDPADPMKYPREEMAKTGA